MPNETPDLFDDGLWRERDARLRALMLAALEHEYRPPMIPEPTPEEKRAFAESFVRASRPRPYHA